MLYPILGRILSALSVFSAPATPAVDIPSLASELADLRASNAVATSVMAGRPIGSPAYQAAVRASLHRAEWQAWRRG